MIGRCLAGAVLCTPVFIWLAIVRGDERPFRIWTSRTFLDRREGRIPDGGTNLYVAADGSIRLLDVRDLNQDGRVDLVLANTHENNEILPLHIFYGADSFQRRVALPTDGGKSAAAADLNRDGWPDLVVANGFDGTKTELNSYVYWGGKEGFTPDRRLELPTQGAESVALGDLNGDGIPEIVVANSGLTYHVTVDGFQQSFIYWGGKEPYSVNRRQSIKTVNARDVKIADVNRDGAPDLIFACEGNEVASSGVYIYLGPDFQRSQMLPGEHSTGVAVADFNKDGFPDIALSNGFRLRGRELGMYNLIETEAVDSFVYTGSAEGFSASRRTLLRTIGARGVDAGDLNQDGYPDLVFANQSGGASYIYWGSPAGFSRNARMALPTARAQRALIGDFNADGRPDIAFANMSNGTSFDTQSFIYWNGPAGFSVKQRAELASSGATGLAAADFDRDGKVDLVIVNKMDGIDGGPLDSLVYLSDSSGRFSSDRVLRLPASNVNSYAIADLNADGLGDLYFPGNTPTIYWNSPEGLSASRKTVVSSRHNFSGRIADFDRDGYLDISTAEWNPGEDRLNLYYGGPSGFSASNRHEFRVPGVRFHAAADLNQDGWLDLIFPSTTNQTVVYWNGPNGFSEDRKLILPSDVAISAEVADLNRDGYLDLIVCNLWSDKPAANGPKSFGGTPEAGLIIYWGSGAGLSPRNTQRLRGVGTEDVAVADLNKDGWLDLVVSSYHAGNTRSHPSYIFWNGPKGFDEKHVTMLETNSASGVMVADFDADGNQDIFIACHSKNGNHRNDSYLYWGLNGTFDPSRRTLLPGLGPHMMANVDIGNIRDRSDIFEYVSPVFTASEPATFQRIDWTAETPFATTITLQVRAASSRDALDSTAWSATLQHPGIVKGVQGKYAQYRAFLKSPNNANSPVLREVRISYR